jgi:hypothetical protein
MSLPNNPISKSHHLRRFFEELVFRRFVRDVHINDSSVPGYISGVLIKFTHVDNLYRIRNAQGKHLQDVGEMLLESNPLLDASSFDREREVRKHIGDYTLFMAGLFPEYVANARRTRGMRMDSLIDFIKAGKESYRIVSSFDLFEYKSEAPLFRQLAEKFELCVYALNLVKEDLRRLQGNDYCNWQKGINL